MFGASSGTGAKTCQRQCLRLQNGPQAAYVKRPLNAFMIWSIPMRQRLKNPEISNQQLSKKLGAMWKSLPAEEKQPYIEKAKRNFLEYKMKSPGYFRTRPKKTAKNAKKNADKQVVKKANGQRLPFVNDGSPPGTSNAVTLVPRPADRQVTGQPAPDRGRESYQPPAPNGLHLQQTSFGNNYFQQTAPYGNYFQQTPLYGNYFHQSLYGNYNFRQTLNGNYIQQTPYGYYRQEMVREYQLVPNGYYQRAPDRFYQQAPDGHYQQTPDGHYQQAPDGHYQQATDGHYQQAPDGQYHQTLTDHYRQAPDGHYQQTPEGHYRQMANGYNQPQAPHGYHQQQAPHGYYQQQAPHGYYQPQAPHGYHQQQAPHGYHQPQASHGYHQQQAPHGYNQQQATGGPPTLNDGRQTLSGRETDCRQQTSYDDVLQSADDGGQNVNVEPDGQQPYFTLEIRPLPAENTPDILQGPQQNQNTPSDGSNVILSILMMPL